MYIASLSVWFERSTNERTNSLIHEVIFSVFELSHNSADANKNTCSMESKDTADHRTVT